MCTGMVAHRERSRTQAWTRRACCWPAPIRPSLQSGHTCPACIRVLRRRARLDASAGASVSAGSAGFRPGSQVAPRLAGDGGEEVLRRLHERSSPLRRHTSGGDQFCTVPMQGRQDFPSRRFPTSHGPYATLLYASSTSGRRKRAATREHWWRMTRVRSVPGGRGRGTRRLARLCGQGERGR
jgi:hypothetical protein